MKGPHKGPWVIGSSNPLITTYDRQCQYYPRWLVSIAMDLSTFARALAFSWRKDEAQKVLSSHSSNKNSGRPQ